MPWRPAVQNLHRRQPTTCAHAFAPSRAYQPCTAAMHAARPVCTAGAAALLLSCRGATQGCTSFTRVQKAAALVRSVDRTQPLGGCSTEQAATPSRPSRRSPRAPRTSRACLSRAPTGGAPLPRTPRRRCPSAPQARHSGSRPPRSPSGWGLRFTGHPQAACKYLCLTQACDDAVLAYNIHRATVHMRCSLKYHGLTRLYDRLVLPQMPPRRSL